jgi:hypothetical protein
MKKISIMSGFLSFEECQLYIDYIENNLDRFLATPEKDKWQFAMGRDHTPLETEAKIDSVPEIARDVRDLLDRVELITEKFFNNKKRLYVSNLILAKQTLGAAIPAHYDQDSGDNPQCKYSAVLYLNSMDSDGQLKFINFNESISPKAGDLVIFPSSEEYLHEVTKISQDRYTIPIFMTEDVDYKLN